MPDGVALFSLQAFQFACNSLQQQHNLLIVNVDALLFARRYLSCILVFLKFGDAAAFPCNQLDLASKLAELAGHFLLKALLWRKVLFFSFSATAFYRLKHLLMKVLFLTLRLALVFEFYGLPP